LKNGMPMLLGISFSQMCPIGFFGGFCIIYVIYHVLHMSKFNLCFILAHCVCSFPLTISYQTSYTFSRWYYVTFSFYLFHDLTMKK
jgi:hypothetical protein